MSSRGFLALILHTHLPLVRHPEQDGVLEERWLFEAITETYLPLLARLQRLAEEGVPVRLTMSFTPTLVAMLSDPLLQERYVRHLEQLLELAEKEIHRTRWQPAFQRLALFYQHRLSEARAQYVERHRRNLLAAFRYLARGGWIEPLASCATHGLLPLLEPQPQAARAQILVGLQVFRQAFGHLPKGFWLPECAYTPQAAQWLARQGIQYAVADAHAVLFGTPRPKYGVFAPVRTPQGLAVFARDPAASQSVWSAADGYPGHPDYREFYRDVGFDLEYEYVRPYINADGSRVSTGLKYYRITGATDEKRPYDPEAARRRAARHAEEFVRARRAQARALSGLMAQAPIIVCPFDAELLGHWWFEGPDWLEALIRLTAAAGSGLELVSLGDYLERVPAQQPVEPTPSSWGQGGYSETWLNGTNDWLYRHLHHAAERMVQQATAYPEAEGVTRRALNQMARELLLAQASDWTFILKAQTHTAYAYRRLREHLARFAALDKALTRGQIDSELLRSCEAQGAFFPSLDYRLYAAAPRS
jgi:1,4-alpha-glucan branching enzyme